MRAWYFWDMDDVSNAQDLSGSAPHASAIPPFVEEDLRLASDGTQKLGLVLGPASFLTPRHVDRVTVGAWMEHGPFAFWLTDVLRPRLFVELGTHTGFSYFSICQAVKEFHLPTKCYAVDTWKGDDHAGFYGEEVFTHVNATNAQHYAGFSQLIRCRFDEALRHFEDGEIDLLHIDGRHRYEDVKGDFESWRPKLSSRGIVLFHDTNVRDRDFGVWKLWQELAHIYPSFEFFHGFGLGVLAVGTDIPPALQGLFDTPPDTQVHIRSAYARLGASVIQQRDIILLYSELDARDLRADQPRIEADRQTVQVRTEREQAERGDLPVEQEAAALRRDLTAATSERDRLLAALKAAERTEARAILERNEAQTALSRLEGKLTELEATTQRAVLAEAARDEAANALARAANALARAAGELDAIRGSTIWRATRPLRSIFGSTALQPVRTLIRRMVRGAYWAVTLQFPARYTVWRANRAINGAPGQSTTVAPLADPANSKARTDDRAPPPDPLTPTGWYYRFRQDADHRSIGWHGTTQFSILMPVYKVRAEWLEAAINSVLRQTYPHWQLICVDDGSDDPGLRAIIQRASDQDSRVRSVMLDRNQGVSNALNVALAQATGDFILAMDHDDLLEPHALARLGDAAFVTGSDIIYGDEVVTGEDSDDILGVQARPVFSHIYYLAHPYFVHPVAIRAKLARDIGGFDAALTISQDVDFVLRALERADKVTHIPDILYRWRTSAGSAGHVQKAAVMEATCAIKTAHLHRIGFPDAAVHEGLSFNTFNVRYFGTVTARILAIVPTKNHGTLLKQCIDSVRATTKWLDLDILVVDHESDDADTLAYLQHLAETKEAQVLPYHGRFNYSAINNHAIRRCGQGYDYFLFLNNDVEATTPGWLEAMLDVAARADVGTVGATLLYPDGLVQHSGVIVGLHGAAEHAFKTVPFRTDDPAYGASLHATREYSAVTAACMMVPADVFNAVGGFDEKLVVGYNDTDLCLRIGRRGYRIVNCAEAILVHHESATRGRWPGYDPHSNDSAAFVGRYKVAIEAGDPHFSPLLSPDNPTYVLNQSARLKSKVDYSTVSGFLPKAMRRAAAAPEQQSVP